mmetsp:Transcript_6624/g.19167  ORF Transcript_6624/g.19167 Transcript_6624/m.19167 type:complete len:290 (-) Transcript_6624:548-1417(-)
MLASCTLICDTAARKRSTPSDASAPNLARLRSSCWIAFFCWAASAWQVPVSSSSDRIASACTLERSSCSRVESPTDRNAFCSVASSATSPSRALTCDAVSLLSSATSCSIVSAALATVSICVRSSARAASRLRNSFESCSFPLALAATSRRLASTASSARFSRIACWWFSAACATRASCSVRTRSRWLVSRISAASTSRPALSLSRCCALIEWSSATAARLSSSSSSLCRRTSFSLRASDRSRSLMSLERRSRRRVSCSSSARSARSSLRACAVRAESCCRSASFPCSA